MGSNRAYCIIVIVLPDELVLLRSNWASKCKAVLHAPNPGVRSPVVFSVCVLETLSKRCAHSCCRSASQALSSARLRMAKPTRGPCKVLLGRRIMITDYYRPADLRRVLIVSIGLLAALGRELALCC